MRRRVFLWLSGASSFAGASLMTLAGINATSTYNATTLTRFGLAALAGAFGWFILAGAKIDEDRDTRT
jgi:hypothetical protein